MPHRPPRRRRGLLMPQDATAVAMPAPRQHAPDQHSIRATPPLASTPWGDIPAPRIGREVANSRLGRLAGGALSLLGADTEAGPLGAIAGDAPRAGLLAVGGALGRGAAARPIEMLRRPGVETVGSNYRIKGAPVDDFGKADRVIVHKNTRPGEGPWRATAMRGNEPLGHRAYDSVEAAQEAARGFGFEVRAAAESAQARPVLSVEGLSPGTRQALGRHADDFKKWMDSGDRYEDAVWSWLEKKGINVHSSLLDDVLGNYQ
jgi:hypothetical protein